MSDNEQPNYLAEALVAPGNLLVGWFLMVTSLGAGFVGGFPLFVFTMMALFGGALILNMIKASSLTFQHKINRKLASEEREQIRQHLLEKLQQGRLPTSDPLADAVNRAVSKLVSQDPKNEWKTRWDDTVSDYHGKYYRMRMHLRNLRELAENNGTNLSPEDIDRLDEVTLDYLRLVFALFNLRMRMKTERTDDVKKQISRIQETLDRGEAIGNVPPATQAQLKRSLSLLQKSLGRRNSYPAQSTALSARLMQMSEDFEDLYHRLSADPSASNLSDFLSDMTEKLSVEEELAFATEMELSDFNTPKGVENLDRYRRAKAAHQSTNR